MRQRREASITVAVAAFAVIGLLLAPALSAGQAYAANPYIGGYRDSSTVHQFSQFYGKMNFAGSTTVTKDTGGVISASGWGSGTDPTIMMYQAPVTLRTDGSIT